MPSKLNRRKKEPFQMVLGIRELFYIVLPFLSLLGVLFIVCLLQFVQPVTSGLPSMPTIVDKVTDGVSVYVAVIQDEQHTHTFILSEEEYNSIEIGDTMDIH